MKNFYLCLALALPLHCYNQQIIDVYESTLKIPAMEDQEYLCGLAAGDQLIFNFEEERGKELREVEILEYPSTSKFLDFKTSRISDKRITVVKTGIYKFRFSNGSIGGRICKFKIQRIPKSEESVSFNTAVYWRTLYDTTYTPVQEIYLARMDTVISNVNQSEVKISSQTALNGNSNTSIVDFTLPENTVSWSYYIGVGPEGKQAFNDQENSKLIHTMASTASRIPVYGPMAALALYGADLFERVNGADNVKYYFLRDWNSVLLFQSGSDFYQYKLGDVVNDAGQMKKPLEGKVYIGLVNDNIMDPIEVIVRATAIQVNEVWETRTVQKMDITSKEEAYLMN